MKVRIIKTDERLGVKAGEIYEARRYRYDPDKVSLIGRVPDGYDPGCNQYLEEVHHFLGGQWHQVVGTRYVPIADSEEGK